MMLDKVLTVMTTVVAFISIALLGLLMLPHLLCKVWMKRK